MIFECDCSCHIRHEACFSAVHLFTYEWRRNIRKTLKKYWKKILMLLKLMNPLIQKVKILISLVYTERKSSWWNKFFDIFIFGTPSSILTCLFLTSFLLSFRISLLRSSCALLEYGICLKEHKIHGCSTGETKSSWDFGLRTNTLYLQPTHQSASMLRWTRIQLFHGIL